MELTTSLLDAQGYCRNKAGNFTRCVLGYGTTLDIFIFMWQRADEMKNSTRRDDLMAIATKDL